MSGRTQLMKQVVIIAIVVAALAGAAYLWGNGVAADVASTSTGATRLSAERSSLQGLAAVRSLDQVAAASPSSAYSTFRGVSAVRSADNAAKRLDNARLNGVAGVRAVDIR